MLCLFCPYLFISPSFAASGGFVLHDCSLCVCVEVSRSSQPNGVMSSAVSLPIYDCSIFCVYLLIFLKSLFG